MTILADDATVAQRILDHIDNRTTDLSDATWREPVENYLTTERLAAEIALVLRRHPVPFCPSAALPETGSFVAREAAQTPLLAVRGNDGRVRAFRNACRHRGTQVATGAGCAKAFVCRYHGWTYGLDGALRHVPHEYGFPGLDPTTRGLVEVQCIERDGLVFVLQEGTRPAVEMLGELPPLVAPGWRLLDTSQGEVSANWKILVEGFIEGYHIRSTHAETFYPVQYDNLNVVETFGPNSRVTYPYRAIEKLRAVPPAERSTDGKLTHVYHLFPNVMLATFPMNLFLVVLEPLAIDRTLLLTYTLGKRDAPAGEVRSPTGRGSTLIDSGAAEDRAVACSIQRSLGSGANEFFEFGRCEGAIAHFHRQLRAALDAPR